MIGHPEGMLQPHLLFANAILVAKLEEPCADDGLHHAVDPEADRADRAGLTVRDIQQRAVGGDATRLGHGGLQARGVDNVFSATAGIRFEVGSVEVHHPYLMRASHGNEQLCADTYQIPGGVERHLRPCARHIGGARLCASPSYSSHGTSL